MLFETGPVSFLFDDEKVAKAAQGYVTCLVAVPDAYQLVEKYRAMRPGLLILNAKGEKLSNAVLHHKECKPGYDPEWIPNAGKNAKGEDVNNLYEYPWVWNRDGMVTFLDKHGMDKTGTP